MNTRSNFAVQRNNPAARNSAKNHRAERRILYANSDFTTRHPTQTRAMKPLKTRAVSPAVPVFATTPAVRSATRAPATFHRIVQRDNLPSKFCVVEGFSQSCVRASLGHGHRTVAVSCSLSRVSPTSLKSVSKTSLVSLVAMQPNHRLS